MEKLKEAESGDHFKYPFFFNRTHALPPLTFSKQFLVQLFFTTPVGLLFLYFFMTIITGTQGTIRIPHPMWTPYEYESPKGLKSFPHPPKSKFDASIFLKLYSFLKKVPCINNQSVLVQLHPRREHEFRGGTCQVR
jgi:hypothetical protein